MVDIGYLESYFRIVYDQYHLVLKNCVELTWQIQYIYKRENDRRFLLSEVFIKCFYFSSKVNPVTLEAEVSRNAVEMKIHGIYLDIRNAFEVQSEHSTAFQTFGPILVAGQNILLMLKTFGVHSKYRNIEWRFEVYSNCILTAF